MDKHNSGKKFVILLAVLMTAILLCACVLSACGKRETVKVSFKVDGEVVKTLDVELNSKLKASDIPSDPQKEGRTFREWRYSDGRPLDLNARIIEDTVFEAAFDKNAIVVTFKNGDSVVHTKTFDPDGGILQATDIPADPQGSGTFSGWWSGSVRAVAGLSITQDTVFEARFVTANVFEGYWVDIEKHVLMSIEDGVLSMPSADVDPSYTPLSGEVLTENKTYKKGDTAMCSAVAGQFVAADEISAYFKAYIVSCDGGDNAVLEVVTDASHTPGVFVPRTERYTLKRCKEGDFPAGKYAVDDTMYFDIASTGVITDIDGIGASLRYGFAYPVEDGYSIEYLPGETNPFITRSAAEIDERGNLHVQDDFDSEIYVKDYFSVNSYVCSNGDVLREYLMKNATIVYVFHKNDVALGGQAYYATIDGSVSGNFTLSYEGRSFKASVTNGALTIDPEEVGTYSGDEGLLVLNDNGEGTLNGADIAYSYNRYYNYVYIDGSVYALNYDNGTYEEVTTPDALVSLTYTYTFDEKYDETTDEIKKSYVSVTFDGYGRTTALLFVNDVETDEGAGIYSVADNKVTLVSGLQYDDVRSGVYGVFDNGNLLVNQYDRKFELIKIGVDYHVDANSVLGYWTNADGDFVEIYSDAFSGYYYVNTSDYNGSDIRATLTLSGAMVNDDYQLYAKVTDSVLYVEFNGVKKTYSDHSASAPITIDDRFFGTWIRGDGTEYSITEHSIEIGGINVDMATVEAYEISGFAGYKFVLNGVQSVLVTDVYNQMWTWEFEHQLYNERGVYRKNASVTIDDIFIDSFVGTARLGDEDNGYNNFEMKIDVTEHAIVFNGENVQYFSCAYSATSGYYQMVMYVNVLGTPMDIKMFYREPEGYCVRFMRIHAYNADDTVLSGTLRAFFNVWQHDDYIIDMDGKGNVTFSRDGGNTSVTTRYTVTDGVAKFTAYDTEASVRLNAEGTLSVTYGEQTFTAEIKNDPFEGIWTGLNYYESWKYELTFDGKGKVSIRRLIPSTGQPQSPDEEPVETTYHVTLNSDGYYEASFTYDRDEMKLVMIDNNTAELTGGFDFLGETFTRQ